jgi:hypothetical protein
MPPTLPVTSNAGMPHPSTDQHDHRADRCPRGRPYACPGVPHVPPERRPHAQAPPDRRPPCRRRRVVDQRGRPPLPGVLADREAVGRPLPRGRVHGLACSSRPRTSPNKNSQATTKRCVSLRIRLREGPVQLAARLGIAPSTVHRILGTARLNRLSHVDRATGEPIRRYEHPHPGSLVHVDVKKLGNIPDGGGWR